jgi:hypothetical protein
MKKGREEFKRNLKFDYLKLFLKLQFVEVGEK